MEDKLIEIETAKLAKEIGFDIMCHFFFNAGSRWKLQEDNILRQCSDEDIIECPTQSLLQRWLREVHNINVESNGLPNIGKYRCLFIPMYITPKDYRKTAYIGLNEYYGKINYNTYEEALEAGLQEALKLIK